MIRHFKRYYLFIDFICINYLSDTFEYLAKDVFSISWSHPENLANYSHHQNSRPIFPRLHYY